MHKSLGDAKVFSSEVSKHEHVLGSPFKVKDSGDSFE